MMTEVVSAYLHEWLGDRYHPSSREWRLTLRCGHRAVRSVKYPPLADGEPFRYRANDEVLPAPKRCKCKECEKSGRDPQLRLKSEAELIQALEVEIFDLKKERNLEEKALHHKMVAILQEEVPGHTPGRWNVVASTILTLMKA